jgi:hypothetical protein
MYSMKVTQTQSDRIRLIGRRKFFQIQMKLYRSLNRCFSRLPTRPDRLLYLCGRIMKDLRIVLGRRQKTNRPRRREGYSARDAFSNESPFYHDFLGRVFPKKRFQIFMKREKSLGEFFAPNTENTAFRETNALFRKIENSVSGFSGTRIDCHHLHGGRLYQAKGTLASPVLA